MQNLDLESLFRILNLKPIQDENSLKLFRQALTHKSFLIDLPENTVFDETNDQYDRLEFLGDSILKTSINEHLFHKFKTYNSGDLTKLSAYLLSDKSLLQIAHELNIKPFVRTGSRVPKESVLSDIMESLFGACYLIYGFETARQLILNLYTEMIEEADASDLKDNYRAALQELSQSKQWGLPEYKVSSTSGPPHKPIFEIEVYLQNQLMGIGKGISKKEASQAASKQAFFELQNKTDQ